MIALMLGAPDYDRAQDSKILTYIPELMDR